MERVVEMPILNPFRGAITFDIEEQSDGANGLRLFPGQRNAWSWEYPGMLLYTPSAGCKPMTQLP